MWRKICFDVFENAWSRGKMHVSFEVQMISNDKYQAYFRVKWRLYYVFDPSNISLTRGDFWKLGNIHIFIFGSLQKMWGCVSYLRFKQKTELEGTSMLPWSLVAKGIVSLFSRESYSQKNWLGECGTPPKTLTIFMAKSCLFPRPKQNFIPYSCPDTVSANIY